MYFVYKNNQFIKAFDNGYDKDKIYVAYRHRYPYDKIEILTG